MAKLIGNTYGEALYELALEKGSEEEMLSEAETLKKVLSENPELLQVMKNPRIAKEEKEELIRNIFSGRVSTEVLNLLLLIVEKDRYSGLDDILDYFITRVKEEKGIGVAFVTTAVSLSEIQKAQIQERLIETTSYNTMEMHYSVDESIIGGMVIRVGDRVVDSSIRSGLEGLERNLQKIQLS